MYTLTKAQIKSFNKFHRKREVLYNTPWLDAIWSLPTWKLVNQHLVSVSRHMAKTRGLWSIVSFADNIPHERRKRALKLFYSSNPAITSDFGSPLPYLDIFPGQILNLTPRCFLQFPSQLAPYLTTICLEGKE